MNKQYNLNNDFEIYMAQNNEQINKINKDTIVEYS